MNKITTTLLLLTFVIFSLSCQNQNDENINTYLNQLYQEGKFNGNVLVIKNSKTLLEKSYGYADGSKSNLLNKDYRFNIGSIYKEFPAVAIMQLQEKNLLALDDKLSEYIPELPKWSETISIKNLLQYSSGLPKISWGEYLSNEINVNDEVIMEGLQSITKLEFEPGSGYLYSNNNPILLIKIVENITQSSFDNYLQENIFNPLGMSDTVFKNQYPYIDKSLMAIPFTTDFKEDDYKISVKSLLLSSTARDMAVWFEQLDDFKIVSMQSVRILSEESKIGSDIQAPLGLCDWKNGKIIEHSHHGSSASYECLVRSFKQDGITIVILTNQKHSNVYDISDDIYKILKKGI